MNTYEMSIIVKGYLDRRGVTETRFKENMPGNKWTESFLSRIKDKLTERVCQNLKRSRAKISGEVVADYFDDLGQSLCVPLRNIVNYDETNLSDDPGRKKVITKGKT